MTPESRNDPNFNEPGPQQAPSEESEETVQAAADGESAEASDPQAEIADLKTTEGLAEIVAAAARLIAQHS